MWLQHANKGAVWSHSRDDRIEQFADSAGHCDRSDPLRHFPLNLPRRVFFRGTVGGDCSQIIVRIRSGLVRKYGFDQPLSDKIGEAPVGSRGVYIVLNRKAEVSAEEIPAQSRSPAWFVWLPPEDRRGTHE